MSAYDNVVDLALGMVDERMSINVAKAVIKTQNQRINHLLEKIQEFDADYSFFKMIKEMEERKG